MCSNIIERHKVNLDRGFKIEQCNSEQLRNVFIGKTFVEWNHLEESVLHAENVRVLKPSYSVTNSLSSCGRTLRSPAQYKQKQKCVHN